ncbi:DNA-protecting protein DprA [Candidatus Woesearchaeota archaeon]|nr:DNA-protecting protein DprA [Candidatus Woesearchaeota archaeon]
MVNDLKELGAILNLLEVKGFGPVKFKTFFKAYKSFQKVFDMTKEELESEFKLKKEVVSQILERKPKLEYFEHEAHKIIEKTNLNQVKIITFFEQDYPKTLFESSHSVPILYVKGNLSTLNKLKSCAVVGTRKPDEWAIENGKIAVKKLVNDGFCIVSGLAMGLDAIAHKTALDNSGDTIAVLGCGIDVDYPKENLILKNEIIKHGIIISEYPPGTKVQDFALKKRNKIIVGLSNYVLIVQTSEKGGTMNSYIAAKEQKKPIGVLIPFQDNTEAYSGNLKIKNDQKAEIIAFANGHEVKFPFK